MTGLWNRKWALYCVHDADDKLIADCRTPDYSTVEAMEHARLIAAAPKLLAALESLLNQIRADGLYLKFHGAPAARAAIAEARGG